MARRATTTSTVRYGTAAAAKYGGLSADERRSQRRERLLAAALDVFSKRGFAESTIQELVEAAGCALRTFYEEFGSREAVLAELYARIMGEAVRRMLAAARSAKPGLEAKVKAGVEAYVETLTADVRAARVALVEVAAVSTALEKLRRSTLKSIVADLAEILAAEEIAIPRPDDLKLAVLALTGSADRLIVEWVLSKGRIDRRQISDLLARMFVGTMRR